MAPGVAYSRLEWTQKVSGVGGNLAKVHCIVMSKNNMKLLYIPVLVLLYSALHLNCIEMAMHL